jgi:hypothetical protein
MGQSAKWLIVCASTGVIAFLAIPVLGTQKVIEILGDTSIEVVIMFAMIGGAYSIYAFITSIKRTDK